MESIVGEDLNSILVLGGIVFVTVIVFLFIKRPSAKSDEQKDKSQRQGGDG